MQTNKRAADKTPKELVLTGRDAYISRLRAGETVSFRESGNSMNPRIKHRQKCTYSPVTDHTDVEVGDAVFCKVGSNYFTHLVKAKSSEHDTFKYLIGNNHGRINGWTTLDRIYGKVIAIED